MILDRKAFNCNRSAKPDTMHYLVKENTKTRQVIIQFVTGSCPVPYRLEFIHPSVKHAVDHLVTLYRKEDGWQTTCYDFGDWFPKTAEECRARLME